MTSKAQRTDEINALRIAAPIFESIYGDHELIPEVIDKPDAALRTQDGKTIGIEIMCMDSNEYLHYTNKGMGQIRKRIPKRIQGI